MNVHTSKVMKKKLLSSLLLTIALGACSNGSPEASDNTKNGELPRDEAMAQFTRIQPFNMSQLPDQGSQGADWCAMEEETACLGQVTHLETKRKLKLRETKPTRFHIYANGRWTDDIEFQVRAPSWTAKGELLDPERDFQFNLTTLAGSGFDVQKQTVILITGYLNTHIVPWQRDAADYLAQIHRGQVNVIAVVWPNVYTMYAQSVAETVMISRQVTVFLHYLAQLGGANLRDMNFLERIHLVGHSLGAHVAGFVGQDLGGRVGRITGLDPAGPSFDGYPTNQRLDRGDAQLVEVLHTNAGKMRRLKAILVALVNSYSLLFSGKRAHSGGTRFGMQPLLGHIDYFANDGQRQEDCIDPTHMCDHARGYQIFVDLLKYQLFLRDNLTVAANQPAEAAAGARRLWAMRVNDFATYKSGSHLASCWQLIEPASHLSPTEVAKTFNKCTVPLMDFTKPTHELIGELRDDFGIDFDPHSRAVRQPHFYFSTKEKPRDLFDIVSKQFVLKVYLDRTKTQWPFVYSRYTRRCKLMLSLKMDNGEQVNSKIKFIQPGQSILTIPFAHPAGLDADVQLQALLGELDARRSRNRPRALIGQSPRNIKRLMKSLFPRSVELELVDRGSELDIDNECELAIKEIEVHPIGLPGMQNVGVISEGSLFSKRGEYEFVGTRKFAARLHDTAAGPSSLLSRGEESAKLKKQFRLTLVDDKDLHSI